MRSRSLLSSRRLTLSSDENERHVCDVSVVIHLRVVLIDRFEAFFILEAEDEDDSVYPMRELDEERHRQSTTPTVAAIRCYLCVGCIRFVSYEQQITLIIDIDLFLESSSFRRLFLHVGAR
jgi:hypothetical protein